MKYTEFKRLVQLYTNTENSTSLTDDDIVLFAKNGLVYFESRIADEVNADFFQITATTDLVADQREYQLPIDLQDIKYIEVMFDEEETNPRYKWVLLEEIDLNQLDWHRKHATSEEMIVETYANRPGRCYVDYFGTYFKIYSGTIESVTDGIKIHYIARMQRITTALLGESQDMSNPQGQFSFPIPEDIHELLARYVSIEYKQTREKPLQLSPKELNFEKDATSVISRMVHRNHNDAITFRVPQGSQVWNDGYDL